MYTLRFIKISMVASIALFFTVVAANNLLDYNTNWHFVQHVMSMDTTLKEPNLMSRAVTNPAVQRAAYFGIIVWQILTAILCWLGSFILLINFSEPRDVFNEAKKTAFIGLFLGFMLYMVGFLIVGGEWFSMWQSTRWNGQVPASAFLSMIMFVMIFLHLGNRDKKGKQ
jgi:predicted small integral membrane protein